MEEVSAPVVAIACILAAVFIPVAFLGGISGQIYRQFALTIAASVLISAFSALSLSPALSRDSAAAAMESRGLLGRALRCFNRAFDWTKNRYLRGVGVLIRRSLFALLGLAGVLLCCTGVLFKILPAGFFPMRIKAHSSYRGSLARRRLARAHRRGVTSKVEDILRKTPGVDKYVTSFGGLDILHPHQQFQRRHGDRHPETVGRAQIERSQFALDSGPGAGGSSPACPKPFTFALRASSDSGIEHHGRFPVHAGRSRQAAMSHHWRTRRIAWSRQPGKRPELARWSALSAIRCLSIR